MNKTIAHMVSDIRSEWDSWSTLYSFISHLDDHSFCEGLGERYADFVPADPDCEDLSRTDSWPITCGDESLADRTPKAVQQVSTDRRNIPDSASRLPGKTKTSNEISSINAVRH
jgi:hypothetical protein